MPAGGSGSQQQASAGSGASDPPPVDATAPTAITASTTATPSVTPSAAAEEVPAAPTPNVARVASSSIPPPSLEETELIFGQQLRSGAELEAAPVPLPWVLSHAHQALQETKAAIRQEWEALESEHQRLSD
jgi:hypothetical protein